MNQERIKGYPFYPLLDEQIRRTTATITSLDSLKKSPMICTIGTIFACSTLFRAFTLRFIFSKITKLFCADSIPTREFLITLKTFTSSRFSLHKFSAAPKLWLRVRCFRGSRRYTFFALLFIVNAGSPELSTRFWELSLSGQCNQRTSAWPTALTLSVLTTHICVFNWSCSLYHLWRQQFNATINFLRSRWQS